MGIYKSVFYPIVRIMAPEFAQKIANKSLRFRIYIPQKLVTSPSIEMSLFGLSFVNPVGFAAGMDKDGHTFPALFDQGVGFLEIGTVTPKPQKGNKDTRLFRVQEEKAVINRFGFNNDGMDSIFKRLKARKSNYTGHYGPIGVNIGKNKNSGDPVDDYLTLIKKFHSIADYFVVNVSSPNTPGLRDMLSKEPLANLIKECRALVDELNASGKKIPLMLKVSPDNASDEAIVDIVDIANKYKIDAILVSNTTINWPDNIKENYSHCEGGLSGPPLFKRSTDCLRKFYIFSKGKIPLIGIGGVDSAETAYEKIRNGASLVQLYTAVAYHGPELIGKINDGLIQLLKRDGYSHISEVIGIDAEASLNSSHNEAYPNSGISHVKANSPRKVNQAA